MLLSHRNWWKALLLPRFPICLWQCLLSELRAWLWWTDSAGWGAYVEGKGLVTLCPRLPFLLGWGPFLSAIICSWSRPWVASCTMPFPSPSSPLGTTDSLASCLFHGRSFLPDFSSNHSTLNLFFKLGGINFNSLAWNESLSRLECIHHLNVITLFLTKPLPLSHFLPIFFFFSPFLLSCIH